MKRTTVDASCPEGGDVPLNLAEAFLEHSRGSIAVPEWTELEALLCDAWETGRARWPQVALPAEAFVRHLAVRMAGASAERAPFASWLGQLALDELYLACACVHHLPTAVEALEQHYLVHLPALLGHLRYSAPMLDDIHQLVCIHLVVGSGDSEPQLDKFTGQGSLLGWIRVVAERIALRQGMSIREMPEENIAELAEGLTTVGQDVENELLKRRFSHQFRQALREGFAVLSGEQRTLLRLYFIEGVSTTELGLRLRLDQSTISRRLKAARQAIYHEAKRCLQERLGLSSRGFESHLKVIDSQAELSVERLMAERE